MAWPPAWPANWHVLPPPTTPGHVPHGLEPGDILLCAPHVLQPNSLHAAIVSVQGKAYLPDAASFVHAAIYAGGGEAYDSTWRTNISRRNYGDVTHGCHVRALRFPCIPSRVQMDLCRRANAKSGQYGILKVVVDGLLTSAGVKPPWAQLIKDWLLSIAGQGPSTHENEPFYCSEFVNKVYFETMGVSVVGPSVYAPLPAAFAVDRSFVPVQIHW